MHNVSFLRNRYGFEVYSNTYGDKESYWLACELAGNPYAFNNYAAAHWSPMSDPIKSDIYFKYLAVNKVSANNVAVNFNAQDVPRACAGNNVIQYYIYSNSFWS